MTERLTCLGPRSSRRTNAAADKRSDDRAELRSAFLFDSLAAELWRSARDELRENLGEVIAMLLEDGEPPLDAEFVGAQTILVA